MAVRGHVDGMIGAYIFGWALAEPDRGNCEIRITDAAGEVLAQGRASRYRPDLEVLGLGRASFAFRIALESGPERRVLRVLADGVELDGSPFVTGSGIFDSDCGVVGGAVVGWITERVSNFEPPLIAVIDQHGRQVGEARAVHDTAELDPLSAKARFTVELADRCFGAGELRLGLFANGVKFNERQSCLPLQGNLEQVSAERCSGWLLSPDLPRRSFKIELYRDGMPAGACECEHPRGDVEAQYPDCGTPGFSIELRGPPPPPLAPVSISLRLPGSDFELFGGPYVLGGRSAVVAATQRAARLAHQDLPGIGPLERAVLQAALSDFATGARRCESFTASQQPGARADAPRRPRLAIIVPIYRGVEVTRACIVSVLAHRDPEADRLVIINDASPDADMDKMLGDYGELPNVVVMANEENLGFVKTVNRGLSFAGGGDVLLLNSDTVLYQGGLDELCRVASSAPEIGTVTALSNNATIFSYPHPTQRREELPDIGWPELAAAALTANAGVTAEVPTGHGFCMLIKGEVLRRVGHLSEEFGRGYGEENDLCQRAADLGYKNVAAASVLVQHKESVSFVGEKASLLAANLPRLGALYPEFTPSVMEFEREDGMRRARWALDRLRLGRAVARGGGFVLVISNHHDGGTVKAAADIKAAADDYGGDAELRLRARADGFIELDCAAPELLAVFAPAETEALFEVLDSASPRQVIIHQLLGYPAGFIARLGDWAGARRGIYYVHDFYSICPRVTMIDAIGRFCNVADADTCGRCVAMGGAHETSKLNELTPAAHRDLFDGLLRRLRHVVAPSANAANYVRRVFRTLTIDVIPHPEPAAGVAFAARAGDDEELVIFGAIGPHKGSRHLLEIARRARLTHPRLKFRIIGYTDIDKQLEAVGNVTITGRYQPEDLPGLIARCSGRLALFLPTWPETYSYTLSEAARYGFIPLAPDIGAPAARIRKAGFGLVFPFPVNAEKVLNLVEDIGAGLIVPYAADTGPDRLIPGREEVARSRAILGVPDGTTHATAATG